jgi:hypothetical protein
VNAVTDALIEAAVKTAINAAVAAIKSLLRSRADQERALDLAAERLRFRARAQAVLDRRRAKR